MYKTRQIKVKVLSNPSDKYFSTFRCIRSETGLTGIHHVIREPVKKKITTPLPPF